MHPVLRYLFFSGLELWQYHHCWRIIFFQGGRSRGCKGCKVHPHFFFRECIAPSLF